MFSYSFDKYINNDNIEEETSAMEWEKILQNSIWRCLEYLHQGCKHKYSLVMFFIFFFNKKHKNFIKTQGKPYKTR